VGIGSSGKELKPLLNGVFGSSRCGRTGADRLGTSIGELLGSSSLSVPDLKRTDFFGETLRDGSSVFDSWLLGGPESAVLWKNSVAALIFDARVSRKVLGPEEALREED
jgi:hypothetical protein